MGNTNTKDASENVEGKDNQVIQIISNTNQLLEAHDNNTTLLFIILLETTAIMLHLLYQIIKRRVAKSALKKAISTNLENI